MEERRQREQSQKNRRIYSLREHLNNSVNFRPGRAGTAAPEAACLFPAPCRKQCSCLLLAVSEYPHYKSSGRRNCTGGGGVLVQD